MNTLKLVAVNGEQRILDTDLATRLGMAMRKLSKDEQTKVNRVDLGMTAGKPMILITESGLYKLVMRSDKPEATEFQNWVTKVVLPAIDEDGGYIHGEEHVVSGAMTEDELMARAFVAATRKLERLGAGNEERPRCGSP